MPFVLFPAFVLKYIEFHCAFVRPSIIDAAGLDEAHVSSRPLLIHTENALDLITSQITKTFQGFLKVCEPSLAQTTVMDLRRSYARIMMKNYRDKSIFPNHDETEFLEILASQMNTSVEQLRVTYIGIDTSDYFDTAKGLVRALALSTDIENTEDLDNSCARDELSGFFAKDFFPHSTHFLSSGYTLSQAVNKSPRSLLTDPNKIQTRFAVDARVCKTSC